MKEVVSIEEVSDSAMREDIKKLEDTMAVEGIAPMVTKRFERTQLDEEQLAEIVSRGIEEPAPSDPVNILEEYAAEVDIEGVGIVKSPTTPIGRTIDKRGVTYVYTPPAASVTKNRVFESGLKVIKTKHEEIPIMISPIIINVCNSLQRKVGNTNEFSIVCKGNWDDDGNYIIGEEYKVPKQQVAGASVDYDLEHLEQLKLDGYNTVIHAHPFKSSNFSSSDDTTINSHFSCSVLYSIGEFTAATISITPTPGLKLVVTGCPKVIGEDNIVPESESNNIEQKYKVREYSPNRYKNQYYDDSYWDKWEQFPKEKNLDACEREYQEYCKRGDHHFVDKYHHGDKKVYDYNPESDILYKNGKPIHRTSVDRTARQSVAHLPLEGRGCASDRTVIPARVFKTDDRVNADQRSGVFKTNEKTQKNKNKKLNK